MKTGELWTRREVLGVGWAAVVAGGQPVPPAAHNWVKLGVEPAEPALRIGSVRQLLVDNHLLCDWFQVRRILGKVKKAPENPVLEADQLWERNARSTGGVQAQAATYDPEEGVFKLWYNIVQPTKEGSGTGYATSRDGIHWTKPPLNLLEFAGEKVNNLCLLQPFRSLVRGLSLIQDSREQDADGRYKAIGTWPVHADGSWYGGWLGIAQSADGIRWHQREGGVRQGSGGGFPACLWDERLQRYVLFHRQLSEVAYPTQRKRYIVRQESADLKNWSPRQTVFNPMDSTWPEVESMMVFRHEGIYFGLAHMLEMARQGVMEIHVATSRDGFRWELPCPGEPFLARGAAGEFDAMLVYLCQTVIHGERMRFYYTGGGYSHSPGVEPIVDDGTAVDYLPRGRKGPVVYRPNKIGLATLPLDRFAGLRFDEPVGAILTRPLLVEGEDLYLNADVDRE